MIVFHRRAPVHCTASLQRSSTSNETLSRLHGVRRLKFAKLLWAYSMGSLKFSCSRDMVRVISSCRGRMIRTCGRSLYRRSSPSNGGPSHALLDTLYALQILEPLLMEHINIELFHDLDNHVQ